MSIFQNNICIIPARGGSKRILRKNIKSFLGIPIIKYSIEAALKSGVFSEVMVSTDDEEIAAIAIEAGAKVPFYRSTKNADDYATTLDVIREVDTQYRRNNISFENICCIYPTAPFVTAEKIIHALRLMTENGYDSVLPIVKYSFPIQRSFYKDDSDRVRYKFPEDQDKRSQDLENTYHDAGQFYWMKASIVNRNSIITTNSGSVECTEMEVQDIDNELDWDLAELKYGFLQNIK